MEIPLKADRPEKVPAAAFVKQRGHYKYVHRARLKRSKSD
jgi:hypothetical protein